MNPFLYQKILHVRRENPPAFSSYRNFKPFLEREFGYKCVYCRAPDTRLNHVVFHIDHYRPKGRFPDLINEYSNLFYSCSSCNVRKGQYWPPESSSPMIPNPCDHIMFRHVRFSRNRVTAHSVHGAWMIEILDLNDENSISFREMTITTLAATGESIKNLMAARNTLLAQSPSGQLETERRDIAVEKLDQRILERKRSILRLTGTYVSPSL